VALMGMLPMAACRRWRRSPREPAACWCLCLATIGDPPSVRLHRYAVTASAPDASSFQIYLYGGGGQNLQPDVGYLGPSNGVN
jgi:hypothetical protein